MGQRATYAHIDTEGNIKQTSVQWSSHFDINLMENLRQVPAAERHDRAARIFEAITKHEHISCVDSNPAADDDYFTSEPVEGVDDFHLIGPQDSEHRVQLRSVGPTYRGPKRDYTNIANYHLDNYSIGAVLDERRPDGITFFWLDEDSDKTHNSFVKFAAMDHVTKVNSYPVNQMAD